MAHSNKIDLNAKVREYEQFANDVLKVDLQKTVEQRARCQLEIDELEELRRNVQQLQQQQEAGHTTLKTRVELGSGVFCRAAVPDTSRLFIGIGLGFHLEVTLQEAGRAIDLRQQALRLKLGSCTDKAARIKAQLKFVAQAVHELMQLPAVQ
ncbi:hypothetical protein OEZ85_008792 [Tetradesmus obliquus]|uniref:Uncharacterized protein n=2 Tax=Tetradesmus obliquus TaxID=3088 RepID=A0A383VF83_TETOB|nr:hypothetical protein OEZ85_008792 [Tetradesmus obliquus]|eukprot:jgi/Sobl393_1/13735/SZX63439.1